MLFYFTGTGNSLHVARNLLRPGERLVNMAEAQKHAEYSYHLAGSERVGFIFPVYCFTLSNVVLRFVQKLDLKGQGYVFSVITCGGNTGHAGGYLKEDLSKRGIQLEASFSLPMPDNTVFYYDLASPEENKTKLKEADQRLIVLKEDIEQEKRNDPGSGMASHVMRPVYYAISGTRAFRVTDACIHCGKCERNCPDGIIRLVNGKPTWTASHCTKCSGCINRCPVQAIQYGRGTEKRLRYVHPEILTGLNAGTGIEMKVLSGKRLHESAQNNEVLARYDVDQMTRIG